MSSVVEYATAMLVYEEGFREDVYLCSEGYPTVGYGLKLGYKDQSLEEYREFPKVPKSIASLWLSELLDELLSDLKRNNELSQLLELDDVRMAVVLSMCYQLGVSGFSKFRKTIQYLKDGEYDKASEEMCDSLWYRQTTNRATRHSNMIKSGVLSQEY